ncbi:MAG: SDR family oxidoreductase [Christensenellaceae bacterium]|jgi:NAD(P)-dependent dehydrogenase (short-subunit alcohol dehydrogenase family)|nr:SDR family oxidoreductase [Christensenellaceae bacterium]
MRFTDKIAVVTGAGRGLGAAYARAFAKEGAIALLIGLHLDNIEKVAQEIIDQGGKAKAYRCDIGDFDAVQGVFDAIHAEFGHVDILVNNAAFHKSMPVVDTPAALWDAQIRVNLNGTFYCTKCALPGMIARRYGKIINISSSAAKYFFPGFGAYSASKGGVMSFTNTLSEEVKQYDINVNSVYLGMVNTEHTRERADSDAAVTIPLDDMMQVEEVAKVVLYLASDEAAPFMGAALDVFKKKA